MLTDVLAEYAEVKDLEILKEFSAPKETKLKELSVVLNKINEDNFCENFYRGDYKRIIKDKLYTVPETKVNYILRVPKKLKIGAELFKKYPDETLELKGYIPNPYSQPNRASSHNPGGQSQPSTESYALLRKVSSYTFEGSDMMVLIDEISKLKPRPKFVIVNQKYADEVVEAFLKDLIKSEFYPVFGLGFNIIQEY